MLSSREIFSVDGPIWWVLVCTVLLVARSAAAQNPTVAGELSVEPPTLRRRSGQLAAIKKASVSRISSEVCKASLAVHHTVGRAEEK
jgi:hypothetical protein